MEIITPISIITFGGAIGWLCLKLFEFNVNQDEYVADKTIVPGILLTVAVVFVFAGIYYI